MYHVTERFCKLAVLKHTRWRWLICRRVLIPDHRVPKELISRFVKICPTCQARRGGTSHCSSPGSFSNTTMDYTSSLVPDAISTSPGCRKCLLSRPPSLLPASSLGSGIHDSQYRSSPWLPSAQDMHSTVDGHSKNSIGDASRHQTTILNQNSFVSTSACSCVQDASIDSFRRFGHDSDHIHRCAHLRHYME